MARDIRERILLMGAPGTGKTLQLVNIARFLEEEHGLKLYCIDLEDKLGAMLANINDPPHNIETMVVFDWDDEDEGGMKQAADWLEQKVKPGGWVAVDRMDLAWSMVQRWFTEIKFDESMADKMAEVSKGMKKPSKFIPRFDSGSWQVINEQYEWMMMRIMYKLRANVIITTGIKSNEDGANPLDVYGSLGVLPRGQREIGHQPHSVFLLTQKAANRQLVWRISTGKDLPGRTWFDDERLTDFSVQYLEKYYKL